MPSTAFVLGAGLGTRLRPLTEVLPKPLIPVCNRPLIHYAFDHLISHGVERFVVNTHWLPQAYAEAFADPLYRGKRIDFREETPEVLETGGGLKNVEDLLGDEPFLVYNGDIYCDLSLEPAIAAHTTHDNEVTLVLRSSGGPLQIGLDADSSRITSIGQPPADAGEARYLFSGIYIVSPRFLERIPAGAKTSVIPTFREMIADGARLGGIVCDDGIWRDLGSRAQYLDVHRHFAQRPALAGGAPWVDAQAELAEGVELYGATAIGRGAKIGKGAVLEDCLIWPGGVVEAGARLTQCIVTGAKPAAGTLTGVDL